MTLEINDNAFEGEAIVQVTGNNTDNVSTTQTFYINVIKNCEYATLTLSQDTSTYNYTVNSGTLDLYPATSSSNDSYCGQSYEHFFYDPNSISNA